MHINKTGMAFVIALWAITIGASFALQDTALLSGIGTAIVILAFAQMIVFAFTGERRKLGKVMLVLGVVTFGFYFGVSMSVVSTAADLDSAVAALLGYAAVFAVVVFASAHLQMIERVRKQVDPLAGVRPWFVNKA
jgi:hypothetical protein